MTPAFLVVDKPAGITSHDVVAAVRAVTGIRKVGHTGTLDPFATGVLPLALGPATRLIQYLDESVKVYEATLALGTRTDTGDPTGTAVGTAPVPALDAATVDRVLAGFVGERMQVPPAYSAVKKDGRPLYAYARKGEVVDVPARPITLHAVERIGSPGPALEVRITCSRGTYARVLAEEIAEALGTVGHLSALCRTRSGPFTLERALSMPALAALVAAEPGHPWQDVLLSRRRGGPRVPWRRREEVRAALAGWAIGPVDALSHLRLADVDARTAARVRSGAPPPPVDGLAVGQRYLVVHGADLVAVAERAAHGFSTLRVVAA